MMVKVETSALGEYFAADPGRDAGLRAGAVGDCTIRAVIRTGEGAL
jgi:hypothetical protein